MALIKENPLRIPNKVDYVTTPLSGIILLYKVLSSSYAAKRVTLLRNDSPFGFLAAGSLLSFAHNWYTEKYNSKDHHIDALYSSTINGLGIASINFIISYALSYNPNRIQTIFISGLILAKAFCAARCINGYQYRFFDSSNNRMEDYAPLYNSGLICLYSFMQAGLFTGCQLTLYIAQVAATSALGSCFPEKAATFIDFIVAPTLALGLLHKCEPIRNLLFETVLE